MNNLRLIYLPGKIVKTFDELLFSLETHNYEFEKVQMFREKNFEFLNGGASDRVIDWLILKDKLKIFLSKHLDFFKLIVMCF